MTIEVVEPGALTSVQDAFGRIGWRHLGVPVGGAADACSARLANRLVGNPDGAALLEVTLSGPILRFSAPAVIALVGAAATLDGLPVPPNAARAIRAGSTLRIGAAKGARAYLAVGGGIAAEQLLGSASTDLRSAFGGHEGRGFRAGDRLEVVPGVPRGFRWNGTRHAGPIRLVAGPHAEAEGLTTQTWTVSAAADRTGVRLDGEPLRPSAVEVPSMGLPIGAVQVPPDGRPIVMLADRPVTGGYPVPACVIGADIGRVAQLRTGEEVRFASVSLEEAREALRRAEEELAALEALDAPDDDELTWVGSLE